jgi:Flp pilus assembly pilin Flp
MVFNKIKSGSGQAMVEYTIILAVLSLVLLGLGADEGSVSQLKTAVQNKQRGYTYALSLSTIPETDKYIDLAKYYRDLGKFPELSVEIDNVAGPAGDFVEDYISITEPFRGLGPLQPIEP